MLHAVKTEYLHPSPGDVHAIKTENMYSSSGNPSVNGDGCASNSSFHILLDAVSADLTRALSFVAEMERRLSIASSSSQPIESQIELTFPNSAPDPLSSARARTSLIVRSGHRGNQLENGVDEPLNDEIAGRKSKASSKSGDEHLKNHDSVEPTRPRLNSQIRSMEELDFEKKSAALERQDSSWWKSESDECKKSLPGWQQRVRHFVESSRFELIFGFAVCSNSAWIGIETDWAARYPTTDTITFYVVGIFYAAVFSIEVFLRILAKGCRFFYDPEEWHWNYFDLISVLGAVIEAVVTTAYMIVSPGDKGMSGVGQVRIVRMIRATRLFRFFRISRVLRFVRALRTLVFSIYGTLKSLFWSMILLVLIIYTFAVIFTQAVSAELGSTVLPQDDLDNLEEYWGNISRSMLTLFMALSDGLSWHAAAIPLAEISPLLLYTFLMYIVFTAFAVMNVITAVFVQSATEDAKSDQEHMVQTVLAQNAAFSKICSNLFRRIDDNNSGSINLNEFYLHYEEVEVQALFEALELEPEDAWSLFKMLDGGKNNAISESAFIEGCMKCRGHAKRIDMFMFVEHYTHTVAQILGFMARTEAQLFLLTGVDGENLVDAEDAPLAYPQLSWARGVLGGDSTRSGRGSRGMNSNRSSSCSGNSQVQRQHLFRDSNRSVSSVSSDSPSHVNRLRLFRDSIRSTGSNSSTLPPLDSINESGELDKEPSAASSVASPRVASSVASPRSVLGR